LKALAVPRAQKKNRKAALAVAAGCAAVRGLGPFRGTINNNLFISNN